MNRRGFFGRIGTLIAGATAAKVAPKGDFFVPDGSMRGIAGMKTS